MSFLRHFWPALAWALLILILCIIPGQELPQWGWTDLINLDKITHAGVFGLLALFIYRGLLLQYGSSVKRSSCVALALIISTLYGVATEVIQGTLVEGRVADPLDQVANMVGIGATWIVIAKGIGGQYIHPSD